MPAPGEPGSETWPQGDQWKTGGGSIWVTGNYDPDTNLAFWGTGNGGPWMGDQRPGDNLYTASTIAIDVATGKIKGYHQYNPNESWDWDEVSPPILVDYKRNGKTIKGLIDVARDGYLWFLERTDGQINFVEGKPFVKQNVFKSLDPKTGRPEVDPDHKPGTGKKIAFLPVALGRQELAADRLQPENAHDLHSRQRESLRDLYRASRSSIRPGSPFTGATITLELVPGADHIGEVQAWNVDTGKRVWTHTYAKSPNWGPDAGDRRAVWSSAAAPTIACFTPSTRRPASCCGNSRPTPASSDSPRPSGSTANSTSPCSRAGAIDSRAMQTRLNTPIPGRVSRGSRGRRHLGLRRQVIAGFVLRLSGAVPGMFLGELVTPE